MTTVRPVADPEWFLPEPTDKPSTGRVPGLLCRVFWCDGRVGEVCRDCGEVVTVAQARPGGRL